jgi:beta-glucanase (GH16 family)
MATISTYRDPRYGDRWTSGGINDARAQKLSQGRYDIRMRADRADGITVVGLLWPIRNVWPPEIDFVEDRDSNRTDFTASLHYLHSGRDRQIIRRHRLDLTAWHTYGVEWGPDDITYTVDGQPWATLKTRHAPRIAMALAIQSNAVSRGRVPDASTPADSRVQIDWVVGYVPKS